MTRGAGAGSSMTGEMIGILGSTGGEGGSGSGGAEATAGVLRLE